MKKVLLLSMLLLTISSASFALVTFTQGSWRWRNDNGAENSTTNWRAAEQGFTTLTDIDEKLRLRVEMATDPTSSTSTLYLQYELYPGIWRNLEVENDNNMDAFTIASTSNGLTNSTPTTSQLNGLPDIAATPFVPGQTIVGVNGVSFTGDPVARYEYEFVIKPTGYMDAGRNYRFRLSGALPPSNLPDIPLPSLTAPLATFPRVFTDEMTNLTTSTALLTGEVTLENGAPVTERGFVYVPEGGIPTLENGTKIEKGSGLGVFTHTLTGLSASTSYAVRTYATNSIGTSYGITILVNVGAAKVATTSPVNILHTSATLGGNVLDEGNSTVVEQGIIISKYSKYPSHLNANSDITYNIGSGPGAFQAIVANLEPNTLYYARAYALNDDQYYAYGDVIIFTTAARLTTTVTSGAGANDATTDVNPIPFTVTFSESVTDFQQEDVAVSNGTLTDFAGSGTTYTFNVIPSDENEITINIQGSVVSNSIGIPNEPGTFKINYSNLLPIKLINFTAKAENNYTKLQWSTSSEINNARFELERSLDGKNFVNLHTLPGNGTTSLVQNYIAYDYNPASGSNYYRLKQVDHNGNTTILGDRYVTFKLENGATVSVYPNPTRGQVNLTLNNFPDGILKVSISNISGRQFHTENVMVINSEHNYKLNLNKELPAGQYIIQLSGANFSSQLKLIIL